MGGEDDVAEDDEVHQRREEGCRRDEAIGVAYLFPSGPFGQASRKRSPIPTPSTPFGIRRSYGGEEHSNAHVRRTGLKLKRRSKAIKCENILFSIFSHLMAFLTGSSIFSSQDGSRQPSLRDASVGFEPQ